MRNVAAVVGIDHQGFVRLKKIGTEPNADQFPEFLRETREVLGRER